MLKPQISTLRLKFQAISDRRCKWATLPDLVEQELQRGTPEHSGSVIVALFGTIIKIYAGRWTGLAHL